MSEVVSVLLVEDDDVDIMAVKRSFRKQKIANPLFTARDGIEALEILRGSDEGEPLKRPYLILLDLNLPRMNGLELLNELRADPDLRNSIVFVLTTSSDSRDRLAAYGHNVAGYIVKTDVGGGFLEVIQMLDAYWKVVEFP